MPLIASYLIDYIRDIGSGRCLVPPSIWSDGKRWWYDADTRAVPHLDCERKPSTEGRQ